jgi:hypothetical protein
MRLSIISIRAFNGTIRLYSGVVHSILRSEAGEDQHAEMASRLSGLFKELKTFGKFSWTLILLNKSSGPEGELCTYRTQ